MDIIFILVEPAVPGNVGSSARAINTMGFKSMRLVAPCDHLNEEAMMFAHGSRHILESASVHQSLLGAIEDIDLIIGTTAKKRNTREDYIDCRDLPGVVQKKGGTIRNLGLVFGREESGLTNEELGLCDLATTIPMAGLFPSLNLAQAVMIYSFLLADSKRIPPIRHGSGKDEKGLKELKDRIVNLLVDIEINKNPVLFSRILERVMLLEEDDIHLFHSVMNKLDRRSGL